MQSGAGFERYLTVGLMGLIGAGLVLRLHPLMGDERALAEGITEDGYLLLTVARNWAMGLGLTVSAGEIWTNGFQPLVTFLFAVPYALTGGDKMVSIQGVLAISGVISLLTAGAVWRFSRMALAGDGPMAALIATALWVSGPLIAGHMMNGLETGLYTLLVMAAVLAFGWLMHREPASIAVRLGLGVLLGLVFLARNDGAFLVAALLLMRFIQVQVKGASFAEALAEAVPIGLVSLLVAAPWLYYNLQIGGSIVPISGQAQSLGSELGANMMLAPVKVFEHLLPMLPIPASLEETPGLAYATGAISLAALALFLGRAIRSGGVMAWLLGAYALYGVALVAYYGLFFGAPHFLSRYFAPFAPLMIVAGVGSGYAVLGWILKARGEIAMAGIGTLAAALGLALSVRVALTADQGHFQVVDWVAENVAEETWVGAVQTGTLGYWHDRTINLDGKVNPAALAARREEGSVLSYVTASQIDVLADWVGIAGWEEEGNQAFSAAFETVVEDAGANLAVLRRVGG